jgi:selenide,water dikinase
VEAATTGAPRLTALSHGAGCACKIGPGQLDDILAALPAAESPALLVGMETRDDAAVFGVAPDMAIVHTADFFTPIVDDPHDFGRIAAANALSDVYAMGARPVTALNLVGFPLGELDGAVLAEILRGGADVTAAAGVVIAGGHSIDDPEPKYGLAVTGVAHPEEIVRNSTARTGDRIYLSKPIGGGAVTTAAKRGVASPHVLAACVEVMMTLNADACAAARASGAHAMTDVTGFGLLGHLHELALASGLAARVESASVPLIAGSLDLLADGALAGGSRRNREWLEPHVSYAAAVPEPLRAMLSDAMTSGGLLVAVPPGREMADAACIGRLLDGPAGRIEVT